MKFITLSMAQDTGSQIYILGDLVGLNLIMKETDSSGAKIAMGL